MACLRAASPGIRVEGHRCQTGDGADPLIKGLTDGGGERDPPKWMVVALHKTKGAAEFAQALGWHWGVVSGNLLS